MLNLQHDVGKWCSEYSWSAEDGMWGVRVLHNFGKLGAPADIPDESASASSGASRGVRRVDEEDAVEGGLKGRLSAGAEFYFSAKERSAGGEYQFVISGSTSQRHSFTVSTGIRFTTLPDATPPSFQLPASSSTSPMLLTSKGPPSQPPTTITALFNPMLGHMSSAYSARVSRDLSLSSRFDFNVYSYESEWTMGAEWWLRGASAESDLDSVSERSPHPRELGEVQGVVKARASTNNVCLSFFRLLASTNVTRRRTCH